MKVSIPVKGQVVKSLSGRDKGCLYVVTEFTENAVFVADGKRRKLSNPKRKNIKHVRLLPHNAAEDGIVYPWNKAFDCAVAHYLKVFASTAENKTEE